jgi:cytochrome oxidase Cu insertion factor (SCO1/SenC/PrrC family)
MQTLGQELNGRENTMMISLAVDPAPGDSDALKYLAHTLKADSDRWKLLSGEKSDVHQFINDSFLQNRLSFQAPNEDAFTITQSIIVIDPSGSIRGYFNALAPTVLDQVMDSIDAFQNVTSAPQLTGEQSDPTA